MLSSRLRGFYREEGSYVKALLSGTVDDRQLRQVSIGLRLLENAA